MKPFLKPRASQADRPVLFFHLTQALPAVRQIIQRRAALLGSELRKR